MDETQRQPQKPKINVPAKHAQIVPLTRRELHETATERVHLISKEFTEGFKFLSHYPQSVTIFGGSHFKESDKEYVWARNLATRIVTDLNYSIVTGGGPGIMEAANRGAFESGGLSVGMTIELPHAQLQNPFLTKNLSFHYFFSRKVCMAFAAEAYVFFPGGYGTLDELFEIVTLVQTNKMEKVPIILVDSTFWNPLNDIMKQTLLPRGTIDESDLSLYTITDSNDEILDIIRKAPKRNGMKTT